MGNATPEMATQFSVLKSQPADALLALIGSYTADGRENKIDLGVGVFKDEAGRTPVFAAVKAAEAYLLAHQSTKSYIGPEGDIGFLDRLLPFVFGEDVVRSRVAGVQAPGGTGALRLGAELVKCANPHAQVHVGEPTWPNHVPVFDAVGLAFIKHRHIDLATQMLCFDEILSALGAAPAGDVVLLHGCCHNPTGADFSAEQWEVLGALMTERGLLPFVDLAYQGLGDGMEADAEGVRILAKHCRELLVAYSCDKNFGLYRERVGALFVLSATADASAIVQSNLLSLARANWSMPPDHGAAVVRVIMESNDLAAQWRGELDAMRLRIADMRRGLADLDPSLAFVAGQKGMFSTLSLTPAQIEALREEHGVYMAGSGRINIAGLVPANLSVFAAALAAVR